MNKRKIIIISSASVVGIAISYFAFIKIRNNKEIKFIISELEGTGGYGSIQDFAKIFAGSSYINEIKAKNPNIILLKNDYITKYRKELYDAIDGVGTDVDAVKSVFRNLKDKIQIAQIADSYQRNYKINLLDAILDESAFKSGSNDANELLNIMKSKLNYRIDS